MMRNALPKMFAVGIICLGLALLASTLAWSRGPEGPRPKRGGPMHDVFLIEKHAERLRLDDKTLEQIRGIVAASKERSSGLYAQLREAHKTMRELLSAATPNEKAVMEQAEKIGAIRNDLTKHHLSVLLQIRPLLTTEQVQELGKIRKERRSPRRHWGSLHGDAAYGRQRGAHVMDIDAKMSRLTERLSLTEEQQAKIRSIFEEQMQKRQAMMAEARKLRQETEAKIQSLLTDDQRAQLNQPREERQQRMHGPGGWGGGKKGGGPARPY